MSDYPKPKKDKRLYNGQPLIHTDSLMEIFDFDARDLETNENGTITDLQGEKITETLKEDADAMWLMLMIFLGVSAVLAVIFALQGYAPLPLVIGAGLIMGALLAISYFRQTKFTTDTQKLESFHVMGVPQVIPSLSSDKQAILHIGNQKLPISYEQAASLLEFVLPMMRIYYASHSKQILSAEVLDNDEVLKLKNENLIEDEQVEVYAERQFGDEQSTMQK